MESFGGSKARKSQEKRHGHFFWGVYGRYNDIKGEFYKNLDLPICEFVPFYPKGLPVYQKADISHIWKSQVE